MKNIPIKKEIEALLEQDGTYRGIYKIKGKNLYLKLISKIKLPQVKIPIDRYQNPQEAINDAITCAKLYKKLIEEELYHPKTGIAIYKDDEGYVSLMFVMPELNSNDSVKDNEIIKERIFRIREKFNLEENLDCVEFHDFNCGCDKKSGETYFYDSHINFEGYKSMLKLAKKIGI